MRWSRRSSSRSRALTKPPDAPLARSAACHFPKMLNCKGLFLPFTTMNGPLEPVQPCSCITPSSAIGAWIFCRESMMRTPILLAALAAMVMPAAASAAPQRWGWQGRESRQDWRDHRRDRRQDNRSFRRDRRQDDRSFRRDRRQDWRDYRRGNVSWGDYRRERRGDVRDYRRELRGDVRDYRRERRGDWRDYRRDRRR